VLVGASLGGAVVARSSRGRRAAAAVEPVNGVAILSAPRDWTDLEVTPEVLRKLAAPKPFAVGAQVEFARDMGIIADAAPTSKDVLVYPTGAHGIAPSQHPPAPICCSTCLHSYRWPWPEADTSQQRSPRSLGFGHSLRGIDEDVIRRRPREDARSSQHPEMFGWATLRPPVGSIVLS
jgi:hypothetical protein